jgi:hypothetical protein
MFLIFLSAFLASWRLIYFLKSADHCRVPAVQLRYSRSGGYLPYFRRMFVNSVARLVFPAVFVPQNSQ